MLPADPRHCYGDHGPVRAGVLRHGSSALSATVRGREQTRFAPGREHPDRPRELVSAVLRGCARTSIRGWATRCVRAEPGRTVSRRIHLGLPALVRTLFGAAALAWRTGP